MRRISFASLLMIGALLAVGLGPTAQAQSFQLPGVIAPSACRVGGVVSLEQFTTTGFSNVRTGAPQGEYVAGAWAVIDNYVPDTSVVAAPNCDGNGDAIDGSSLNLMGVRLKPTMVSAAEADIQQVKLVHDVNMNGLYEPGLDLTLQTRPGDALDGQDGAEFFYGPQAPLAMLANPGGTTCKINRGKNEMGSATASEQNSRLNGDCAMSLLAVVKLGENPETNSQFGLELHAAAGDIPGTAGGNIAATTESSGFSSSRNPQASNVRLQVVGGQPGSETDLSHLSNGSGNPESAVRALQFTGGQSGEGLLTRFRKQTITPGTREAIAIAVGICDGGELANTNASILPSIASSTPQIAGGLSALPCVRSDNIDKLATGINGATLVFNGPLAPYMGNVRMYLDVQQANRANDVGGGTTYISPGNGQLFQPGELVAQVVPEFNEPTGEAIARIGPQQAQILTTGRGTPVATPGSGVNLPVIIIFTVDIDENAPGGQVGVELALSTYDDTAQGSDGACNDYIQTIATLGKSDPFNCGSNFLNAGPETQTFNVKGQMTVEEPSSPGDFDENGDGVIGDDEFFNVMNQWTGGDINDDLFFAVLDAWVGQTPVGAAQASALSLSSVSLGTDGGTTTFVAHGQGIHGLRVDVYGLGGERVARLASPGQTLRWAQTNGAGQPLANGVYLYRVTVEGADGHTVTSRVGKLVVVR